MGGRGSGVGGWGGQLTPQHSDRYDNYSGKRQYICLTNRVTERNKYPSTEEIHFGWSNKGHVNRSKNYGQKIGSAIVHYYLMC